MSAFAGRLIPPCAASCAPGAIEFGSRALDVYVLVPRESVAVRLVAALVGRLFYVNADAVWLGHARRRPAD